MFDCITAEKIRKKPLNVESKRQDDKFCIKLIDLAGFMKLFVKFDTDLMLWVTIPNRVTEDWYPSKDQIRRVWSNKVLLTGKYSLCSLLVGRAIVHHYEFGR